MGFIARVGSSPTIGTNLIMSIKKKTSKKILNSIAKKRSIILINDMLEFSQSIKDENLKNRTYDLRIETLLLKLEKLKATFLSEN